MHARLDRIVMAVASKLGSGEFVAFDLGPMLGLWLRPRSGARPELRGRHVVFTADAPLLQQLEMVRRMAAIVLLRDRGMQVTADDVSYLALALAQLETVRFSDDGDEATCDPPSAHAPQRLH